MLQQLREKVTSWVGIAVLGVAIFVFSFFGIEGYFSTQADTFAAKVNGQEISQQDLQTQMNQMRQRARQNNPDADQSQFSTPEFKRQVLEGLINRELLRQANEELGVAVSNDMIRQQIAAIPAFQINGRFDPDTYKAVLGQMGLTPIEFQQRVRQDIATSALPDMINDTALAPDAEVAAFLRLTRQTRDVSWVTLPKPPLDDTTVTDAQIKAWYDAHPEEFAVPETVSVHYVELKADDMTSNAQPTEEAIKAQYEREKAKFTTPEQREVSHILVSVPDNATPAQQKAALAKAKKIEAELKAGADFAALAKKDSDDLGSKRLGGDLGWIEKGVTDPAFESALFAMKKGEVSEPVLSPEGYHIIWLRDVRPGKTKPLAEVRDQLSKELTASSREAQFREIGGKLTDMIYSNPGSLDRVAEKLGLKVQTSQPFSREGGPGIAANPAVVRMAFSDQVLKQDMTSDPVNVSSDDMIVMHLAHHKAASTKPLAEVKAKIKSDILAKRTETQAQKQAKALLASLGKDKTLQAIAEDAGAEVKTQDALTRMSREAPPPLLAAIFKMPQPTAKAPSRTLVDMGNGRYALVSLRAVHPGDPAEAPAAQRQTIAMQLQQLRASAEQRGLVDILRRNAEIVYPKNAGGAQGPDNPS
ncbi:MAG TPA: SurA N-terminal domain-containing protein [Rhodanobacteraceae bacterium]|nr:SurA N-terminal domain-containing protein [Rhodanobacteraceae bacterium]